MTDPKGELIVLDDQHLTPEDRARHLLWFKETIAQMAKRVSPSSHLAAAPMDAVSSSPCLHSQTLDTSASPGTT